MKYEKPTIEEIKILETQIFLGASGEPQQEDDPFFDDDTSFSSPLRQLSNFWADNNSESEAPTKGDNEYKVVEEPVDSGSFFGNLFGGNNDAGNFSEPDLEPTNDDVGGFE